MAETISGRLSDIILAHFKPHEDLRKGLMEVIKKEDIKSGVVLSITGALENATLQHASAVGPPTTVPFELINVPGPLEVSGHGIIGLVEAPTFGNKVFGLGDDFINGEPYIHVHLTVTSATQTICGHLMDGCLVRSIHASSHFTIILGRIEGAMIKMMGESGKEPGSFIIGHKLVKL